MSTNYVRTERVSQSQSVATLAARRAAQKTVVAQDGRSQYRRRIDKQQAATLRSPLGSQTVR